MRRSKLDEQQVRIIRGWLDRDLTPKAIVDLARTNFGTEVTVSAVSDIAHGWTWRDLEGKIDEPADPSKVRPWAPDGIEPGAPTKVPTEAGRKLNEDLVRKIRVWFQEGRGNRDIAVHLRKEYGVRIHDSSISDIRLGKTWRKVR